MKQIDIAREEHALTVSEPPGKNWERITVYIHDGLGWTWESPYRKNRDFEWCGAFVSFCFASLVSLAIRKEHFASCYRLWRWSRKTPRFVKPQDIVPGDIVIVGPAAGFRLWRRWGRHITLCVERRSDAILTIEGNATGTLGNDTEGEGVVKQRRPFKARKAKTYRVLYGVRPLQEDKGD